jgi:hypothetical protein
MSEFVTADKQKQAALTPEKGKVSDFSPGKISDFSKKSDIYSRSTGRDFSGVPANTTQPVAPAVNRTAACPMFPRRCPFGGACHTCPVQVQTNQ